MKKIFRSFLFCFVVAAMFWACGIISDQAFLSEELIRMHIVANSDSEEDQKIKYQIRDAVCASIESDLKNIQDHELASEYLKQNLPKIKHIADQVLKNADVDMETAVSLCREYFHTRQYDTFQLPAGIYETLRITIGNGSGENWWCVSFPSLCSGETEQEFKSAAAGAGFSEKLADCLMLDEPYELRFYLLDFIGSITGRLYHD